MGKTMEKGDLSFFVIQRMVENKTYYDGHKSGSSRIVGTRKR